jgi:putative phosphoribosyl transferase
MRFRDRADAGQQLAERLRGARLVAPIVLGLPRGGIPVAAEVAAALGAPLDVFVARKVGTPGHEELGIGAVAEGLEEPVVSDVARQLGISAADLRTLADRAQDELRRRVALYRGGRSLPPLIGRDVIVVDDGLATGVTAEAALRALRRWRPSRLVLAVPVCARETAARLAGVADEVVCVETPAQFYAVGEWYQDFSQTTDEEVLDLLERAHGARGTGDDAS